MSSLFQEIVRPITYAGDSVQGLIREINYAFVKSVEANCERVAIWANGVDYVNTTTSSGGMTPGSTYICNSVALITLTLPSVSAVGDTFKIVGWGAGGWKVAQRASQYIYFGNSVTTTGTTGYLQNTNAKDCIEFRCVIANLGFTVVNSIGNITIV